MINKKEDEEKSQTRKDKRRFNQILKSSRPTDVKRTRISQQGCGALVKMNWVRLRSSLFSQAWLRSCFFITWLQLRSCVFY